MEMIKDEDKEENKKKKICLISLQLQNTAQQ